MIKYFEYRGYDKFLTKMPGASKFGVSASVKMHQQIGLALVLREHSL